MYKVDRYIFCDPKLQIGKVAKDNYFLINFTLCLQTDADEERAKQCSHKTRSYIMYTYICTFSTISIIYTPTAIMFFIDLKNIPDKDMD